MMISWFLVVPILAVFIIYSGANQKAGRKLSEYVPITFAAIIMISIAHVAFFKPGSPIGPEMMKIFAILSVTALSVMIIIEFFQELVATLRDDSFSSLDLLSEPTATSDCTINMLGFKIKIPQKLQLFLSIALIALASRIIIYFIGYFYSLLVLNQQQDFLNSFVSLWLKWDTEHYLEIARNGYRAVGDRVFVIVFYPLYPMLIRLFAKLTGDFFTAAIIVSNLASIIASYYLYQLTRLDFDEDTSYRAVKYIY